MAIGDLVTTDLMFEFAGTAFGGCCTGSGLEFMSAAGLDMPTLRSGDITKPRDHGELAGVDYFNGRSVDLDIGIVGTSAADLEAKLRTIALMGQNVGMTEQKLVFQLPGQGKRFINARLRRRAYPVDVSYIAGKMVKVALQFHATDPRIYDNSSTNVSLALPMSTGGLSWPISWPVAWGTSVSGFANLVNSGVFSTFPVVTFIGPLTAPSIQNVTTGETWYSTFDLLTGDTLVVDFANRTALLNGTASRYSYITSSSVWWDLNPGTTQVRIGASAGSGSATISFNSAWA